jgi:uncharacterized protein YodC (DUF2158 family)
MKEITVGRCVRLKSGGPPMTVARITGGSDMNTLARCEWFPPTGGIPTLDPGPHTPEVRSHEFDVRCLKLIDEPEKK